MQIEHLDLETRSKIYNYTKKVLRKYQKGIMTGKLTPDKFVENIISNGYINDILDENILSENEFKESYTYYIVPSSLWQALHRWQTCDMMQRVSSRGVLLCC